MGPHNHHGKGGSHRPGRLQRPHDRRGHTPRLQVHQGPQHLQVVHQPAPAAQQPRQEHHIRVREGETEEKRNSYEELTK